MVLVDAWVGFDELSAAPGGVVGPLAFAAVVESDAVSVLLVELVGADVGLGELGLPKGESVLEGETDAFEEETVGDPPAVLEVMVGAELVVHVLHAQGEGGAREGVQLARVNGTVHGALEEVLALVGAVKVLEEGPNPLVLADRERGLARLDKALGEMAAEPRHQHGDNVGLGDDRQSRNKENPTVLDKINGLHNT